MAYLGHPYLELLLVYMVLENIKTASEVVNFKTFLGEDAPRQPYFWYVRISSLYESDCGLHSTVCDCATPPIIKLRLNVLLYMYMAFPHTISDPKLNQR